MRSGLRILRNTLPANNTEALFILLCGLWASITWTLKHGQSGTYEIHFLMLVFRFGIYSLISANQGPAWVNEKSYINVHIFFCNVFFCPSLLNPLHGDTTRTWKCPVTRRLITAAAFCVTATSKSHFRRAAHPSHSPVPFVIATAQLQLVVGWLLVLKLYCSLKKVTVTKPLIRPVIPFLRHV